METHRCPPTTRLLAAGLSALLFCGCQDLLKELGIIKKTLDAPVFVSFEQNYDIRRIEIEWTWPPGSENFQLMARDVTAGGGFVEVFWGDSKNHSFYGNSMPGGGLVPGHTYEFKVRAHSNDTSFSAFSGTGSYRIPAFVPPTGPSALLAQSNDRIILAWTAVESADHYYVYRSTSMYGNYSRLNGWPTSPSFEDTTYATGGTYYYKVTAYSQKFGETEYSIVFWPGSTSSLSVSGSVRAGGSGLGGVTLVLASAMPLGTTTTGGDGGYTFGSLAPGTYSVSPSLVGYVFTPTSASVTVTASGVSGVDFSAMPVLASSWSDLGAALSDTQAQMTDPGYGLPVEALRLVDDGSGVPVLGYLRLGSYSGGLQYAGALRYALGAWNPIGPNADGSLPSTLPNAYPGAYHLSLAANGSTVYLAAMDSADVFIHSGTPQAVWSPNLADANFSAPKELELAFHGGQLYAAQVAADYNVKVLKWDGASWSGAGGTGGVITSSGKAWDLAFGDSGGTLYVAYTEDLDSDGHNDRLSIASWDGSSWNSELSWVQDFLQGVRVQRAGGSLYFSVGTSSSDFSGGAYRVTGPGAAVQVMDSNLYGSVQGLAADSAGRLFVLGGILDLGGTNAVVPRIYRWDGSALAQVQGAYSDMMRGGRILGAGGDLYFVRGVYSSRRAEGIPSVLWASKVSP